MKKSIRLLFVVPFLASCGGTPASSAPISSGAPSTPSDSSSPSSASNPASSAEAGEYYLFYKLKEGQTKEGLAGSPWLNPSTQGVVSKIEKPSLKDDFFIATNYDYLSSAKLEEGQIGQGGMISALEKLQQNYLTIVKEETGKGDYAKALRQAHAFYEVKDKSKEIASVKKLMDEIKAISSMDDLFSFLTSKRGGTFGSCLFEIIRQKDALYLYDDNVGWTIDSMSTPFFNNEETEMENIVTKFAPVLQYFGYSAEEAPTLVREALTEEANLRSIPPIPVSETSYTVGTIDENFPKIKLSRLFKALGYQDSVAIQASSRLATLLGNLEGTEASSLANLKKALIVRVALGAKSILPTEMYVELAREFDPNTNGYNDEMFERERFIEATRSLYDRAYVDNFETRERKQAIITLMEEVKSEYKNVLNDANWLSSETKGKAKEKVDAIRFDACYPDHLLSLPSFSVDSSIESFYDLKNAYREWAVGADQPVFSNPELWVGSITTMNAVYYPTSNSFVLYEGMLSTNDTSADDVEGIYATIGAVIGHEISHSFDTNGARYDKYGVPDNWWTPEDEQAFEQKAQKIIDAWDKIYYRDNTKTWADKMIGEIIADMGGISVMLKLASKKTNFNYKKFFLDYSSYYASVFSAEFVEQMFYMEKDVHPMNYLRVNNVLNQFAKFQETFQITSGDKMYVAEADRLSIW